MKGDPQLDPKGLIEDSYRIDGISQPECRSIFLDWALSLPESQTPQAAIAVLLDRHEGGAPEHPMTQVLREGMAQADLPRRRGGRRGRL